MIAVSYIMERKIKKIFFELVSNSKIFNIIFSTKLSTTKIFPNLQRGLDNVEYGRLIWLEINLIILKVWPGDHNWPFYWATPKLKLGWESSCISGKLFWCSVLVFHLFLTRFYFLTSSSLSFNIKFIFLILEYRKSLDLILSLETLNKITATKYYYGFQFSSNNWNV